MSRPIRNLSLHGDVFIRVLVGMEPKYHKLFLSCRLLVLVGVREVFLLELVWVPIVDHWASIHLVVSNRVAERFQMHSDLMSSPRL